MLSYRSNLGTLIGLVALIALVATPVAAKQFGEWSTPRSLELLPGSSTAVNTESLDGCPIQSPDGLRLFMASNRAGGLGGIDIWVAQRPSTAVGFGTPVNLGAPINSAADDFCPTPVRGKGLFFVSSRSGGCGAGADIYFARLNPAHGWGTPAHLGCEVNSAAGEASPSYVEEAGQGVLYFSSNRTGESNIYRSVEVVDGSFAAPAAVAELNTASEDARPNVRKDGLEIVFDSTRPGGSGGPDIYAATRGSVYDPWSAPVNLGTAINSAAPDTRASLSWDGQTLLFGSGRAGGEGSTDIYVSTR
ncbi:MAG: PD40 domain-containing protein [Chloroflexi bacterium]|nr:PD40 domain-containing protein [Chloroflexota bacterium]